MLATYPMIDPEARRQRIADAAYYRYELRGREPGHELEDWLWAEREVDVELKTGGIVPAPQAEERRARG